MKWQEDALANGDKILSENYFQHADHFTRILNEQESYKKSKIFKRDLLKKKKMIKEMKFRRKNKR